MLERLVVMDTFMPEGGGGMGMGVVCSVVVGCFPPNACVKKGGVVELGYT